MKIFSDILLAVPIGFIYNILFYKLGEIITMDLEYNEKIQRNLLISFIGGISGIFLALNVFGNKNYKYKNRAIKYGLFFGSVMLLFYTLCYNWDILGNDIKLFIIIMCFITLLWYSYLDPDSENNLDHDESE